VIWLIQPGLDHRVAPYSAAIGNAVVISVIIERRQFDVEAEASAFP